MISCNLMYRPDGGNPNPILAMRRVETEILNRLGDRDDVPNYVVFITTSIGGEEAVDAINRVKRTGAKVIGVGKLHFYFQHKSVAY